MKKLLRFLLPYRRQIALATLLMTVSAVCSLVLPTVMSDVLDRGVYRAAEPGAFDGIVLRCLLMLVLALLSLGSVVLGYRFATRVTACFTRDLRGAMYRKVNTMRFDQLADLGPSVIVTRMTHDAGTLAWVAGMLCGNIIIVPLMFVGGVVLCMRKDLLLSLIMLASVPLVFLLVLVLAKRITPLWERGEKYTDLQNGLVRSRIRGIRVIRAFGRESRAHERIVEATTVMTDSFIRGNIAMELVPPLATLLMNLAVLAIVFVGGLRLERGAGLSAGDVFAVIQYVSVVLTSLISASWSIVMLPHTRVAARRISEITELETAPEPCDDSVRFTGEIRLEHLRFCYAGADRPALDDVSLEIPAGTTAAIIGGTGSGKSTLAALLLAFYRPTSGRILFDGVDAAQYSGSTIRNNVSCALQKPMLYAGTVADNIRMGAHSANDEALLSAAETAQLSAFLSHREKGLGHVLTTGGGNVSGGQKQRIAIARALLKDAPIYLFDDCFSALDFLTEKQLRTALNERLLGKTQLVISQRVTTAMRADRIFVLDRGRLVGAGTHAELLKRCAVYREIYASQTGGDAV